MTARSRPRRLPAPVDLGTDARSGKRVLFLSLASLAAWPRRLALPSRRFGLFLACDARRSQDAEILAVARAAVGQGAAFVAAWGPECYRVHDLFDQAAAERDPDPPLDRVVLTTWHPRKTVADALDQFLDVAAPAGAYARTCRSWLAVVAGSAAQSAHVLARLRRRRRSARPQTRARS